MSAPIEAETTATSGEGRPWLFLTTRRILFGIDVRQVEELCDMNALTPLPRAPAFLPGLMNLRGDPIPILDLGLFLDLPSAAWGADSGDGEWSSFGRIVITRCGPFRVGLQCDRVCGVAAADDTELHTTELVRGGRIAEFSLGELENNFGPAALLDLENLLTAARLRT